MDELFIPSGMVQSAVATATLLFEALRQRQAAGVVPTAGEGMTPIVTGSCCSSGVIQRSRPPTGGVSSWMTTANYWGPAT